MTQANLDKKLSLREKLSRFIPELTERLGYLSCRLLIILDDLDLCKEAYNLDYEEIVDLGRPRCKEYASRDDDIDCKTDSSDHYALAVLEYRRRINEHSNGRISDYHYLICYEDYRKDSGSLSGMYSLIMENIYLRKLSAGRRRRKIAEQNTGHVGNKCLPQMELVSSGLADEIKYERIDEIVDQHYCSHYAEYLYLSGPNGFKYRAYLFAYGQIHDETADHKYQQKVQDVFSD